MLRVHARCERTEMELKSISAWPSSIWFSKMRILVNGYLPEIYAGKLLEAGYCSLICASVVFLRENLFSA